ncbi:MAG: 50S ribosomal protein L32 [Chloroflexi bacterium]|nr:50S ribosomal protein L32 [Chloroflexota bacterium]
MVPLPKRRFSKGRTHRRRSHDALRTPNLTICPTCKTPRLPHHICPNCGSYKGVQVLEVEEAGPKK